MRLKKQFQFIALVFLTNGCSISGNAQQLSLTLEITYNKTTSIVFPDEIASVDRGSRDLLAQKAKGVDNVLQVKAARQHFPETNLTVITSDGTIREFTVRYAQRPRHLVRHIGVDSLGMATVIFPESMTEPEIRELAAKASGSRRNVRFVRDKSFGMKLSLLGVYIKEDVVFYHVRIDNETNIKYDVDFVRFYIRDLERVKRTASQEVEVTPLFVYEHIDAVKGGSSIDVVYAMRKFTIPDAKKLVMEVFEKNGGRHLDLSIKNKTIVQAQRIN
jgi:conjugative transposon TraN protein